MRYGQILRERQTAAQAAEDQVRHERELLALNQRKWGSSRGANTNINASPIKRRILATRKPDHDVEKDVPVVAWDESDKITSTVHHTNAPLSKNIHVDLDDGTVFDPPTSA